MATKKGVWNLQQVRDKQLQDLWSYSGVSELWVLGGNNDYGNLGQNNRTKYSSPVQIPGNWSFGVGSYSFSSGLKPDGTLWVWGDNNFGQLGQNQPDGTYKSSPTQIPGTWSAVDSGYNYHMLGIKTDGTLWAWGYNNSGELGQNNQTNYSSPVQVGSDATWSTVFGELQKSFATKTDGTLWSWGYNGYGYLGLNDRTMRSSPTQVPGTTWKKISGGLYHLTAAKTDGTIWAWGYNAWGNLGQSQTHNTAHRSSPAQIPGTDWNTISSGGYQNLALKTDGTMFGWGYNAYGQLGQNNTIPRSSPVQVPGTNWGDQFDMNDGNDSYAIKTDGTLWSWGEENNDGRMGHNTTAVSRSSPTQVGGGTNWDSLQCGGSMGVLVIKAE